MTDAAARVTRAGAGYRFGDYWRLGMLLPALMFLVAVLLVPVIWPL